MQQSGSFCGEFDEEDEYVEVPVDRDPWSCFSHYSTVIEESSSAQGLLGELEIAVREIDDHSLILSNSIQKLPAVECMRRLVVTGLDTDQNMKLMFGEQWSELIAGTYFRQRCSALLAIMMQSPTALGNVDLRIEDCNVGRMRAPNSHEAIYVKSQLKLKRKLGSFLRF
jgi:hypothetical protein